MPLEQVLQIRAGGVALDKIPTGLTQTSRWESSYKKSDPVASFQAVSDTQLRLRPLYRMDEVQTIEKGASIRFRL